MVPPSRAVVEALVACRDPMACLALVLETEGSTYVGAGGMALFGYEPAQVGWLSGGCLEAGIAQAAAQAARAQRLEWLALDTRGDEALYAGSTPGCRGRLHLALLPLRALAPWPAMFAAWWQGREVLQLELRVDGELALELGTRCGRHRLDVAPLTWPAPAAASWTLRFAPPPRLAVFGAGPETPSLLPLLRSLGWHLHLVESRARWTEAAALADRACCASPARALEDSDLRGADAALVMHHDFERDREALAALAPTGIGFIGLLGPNRRREDLWRVLPATAREALEPRLHSPVGLRLGGRGAEAIALSIAAELQAWRHGE